MKPYDAEDLRKVEAELRGAPASPGKGYITNEEMGIFSMPPRAELLKIPPVEIETAEGGFLVTYPDLNFQVRRIVAKDHKEVSMALLEPLEIQRALYKMYFGPHEADASEPREEKF